MAERDANGRFVKGHKGFKKAGRPPRCSEERFLTAILRAIPEDGWEKATKAVLARAKKGDVVAWKALAAYLVGTPVQRIETEVVDTVELAREFEDALERGYGGDR